MRYPPALTFTPSGSWVYRSAALIITIILIALCAISLPANGLFSSKNGVFIAIALLASVCLLRDAFKRVYGSLHYAQGTWQWHRHCQPGDDEAVAGTCAIHLDLQSYMLVRFTAHPADQKTFLKTTQWFHLEAKRADHAVNPGAWLALRRALLCPAASADETVAA